MAAALIQRFAINAITLLAVLLLTFLLLHLLPGGPFDQERHLPPEIEQNLYAKYGLSPRGDSSLAAWVAKDTQAYLCYLSRGELGPSLKYRDRDVREIIAQALGPSLELGAYALGLSLSFGILAGLLAVGWRRGPADALFSSLATFFVSFPAFVVAVFLILAFALYWPILPPALWEDWSHRVLPSITLALAPAAYFFQFTRTGLKAQTDQMFFQAALAKGVGRGRALVTHALKNAAGPLLSVIGPMAAYLVTGSFIVETIFSVPGLGRHFVTAVTDRDYFLVMGITLVYAVILITLNWLVDLAQLWLDPRGREEAP